MKLQKTKKSSKLDQASTLLNQIENSNLNEVAGGCGEPTTLYKIGDSYQIGPTFQCHDRLN